MAATSGRKLLQQGLPKWFAPWGLISPNWIWATVTTTVGSAFGVSQCPRKKPLNGNGRVKSCGK
jgi:hypothetical protein